MKTLILFLIVSFSCAKPDDKTDCKCDAKFITECGEFYELNNLPIDCDTRKPDSLHSRIGGGVFYDCEKRILNWEIQ